MALWPPTRLAASPTRRTPRIQDVPDVGRRHFSLVKLRVDHRALTASRTRQTPNCGWAQRAECRPWQTDQDIPKGSNVNVNAISFWVVYCKAPRRKWVITKKELHGSLWVYKTRTVFVIEGTGSYSWLCIREALP